MSNKQQQRAYKDLFLTFGPALVVVLTGFLIASKFISPAPPKKIIIATGSKNGAYYHYAERYRQQLGKLGIELQILESSGSRDNIKRLLQHQADAAFVQGGTGQEQAGLLSLGSLYYEPVWLFVRKNQNITRLNELMGKRIAIGEQGSGTQMVAKQLLALNGINANSAELRPLSSQNAKQSLSRQSIDAAFFVAATNSPVIQDLLHDNQVYLLDFKRALAYSRRLPFLSEITLPEGVIDLQNNIPGQDVKMIAPAANLVVREDLHSALVILLLQAATQTHRKPSLFAETANFPGAGMAAFPLSDVAERYYKVGPPLLMRYLPFWAAVFVDRTMVMLIPLLALLFPLFKIMPPVYRWRVRSKIYRWYKELQEVDNASFRQQLTAEQFQHYNRELDRIEEEVNKVKTPLSYADQLYNLLLHIDLVRKNLTEAG